MLNCDNWIVFACTVVVRFHQTFLYDTALQRASDRPRARMSSVWFEASEPVRATQEYKELVTGHKLA